MKTTPFNSAGRLAVAAALSLVLSGPVESVPEEELNLVGADIMDEITLGWIKLFRPAYPRLSVTMQARSSGSGVPALTEGTAHMAPVGREALPVEHDGFVKKFGYEPFAIKVATGSLR